MSRESTPILCGVIPSFETFMSAWEKLQATKGAFADLKAYVQPGLVCAYEYYGRMDRTQGYIITMRKCPCLPASDYSANCYLQS